MTRNETSRIFRELNSLQDALRMDAPQRAFCADEEQFQTLMEHWRVERDQAVEQFWAERGFSLPRGGQRPARIGKGIKVHRLTCQVRQRHDGDEIVVSAHSYCGSQQWTNGGFSSLTLLADGTPITCGKCNG